MKLLPSRLFLITCGFWALAAHAGVSNQRSSLATSSECVDSYGNTEEPLQMSSEEWKFILNKARSLAYSFIQKRQPLLGKRSRFAETELTAVKDFRAAPEGPWEALLSSPTEVPETLPNRYPESSYELSGQRMNHYEVFNLMTMQFRELVKYDLAIIEAAGLPETERAEMTLPYRELLQSLENLSQKLPPMRNKIRSHL